MDPKLCVACGKRKALYFQQLTGRYVWSRDHDLCRQCWRSERDRTSARDLVGRRIRRATPSPYLEFVFAQTNGC